MPLWWNGRHNEFKPRTLQVRLLSEVQKIKVTELDVKRDEVFITSGCDWCM